MKIWQQIVILAAEVIGLWLAFEYNSMFWIIIMGLTLLLTPIALVGNEEDHHHKNKEIESLKKRIEELEKQLKK